MNHDAQLTWLAAHADRLNRGEVHADRLLWQHGPFPLEMVALMALARRLKRALTPFPAPEPFRSRLQRDLLSRYEAAPIVEEHRSRRPLWYSLAAVGSVLPLLGIVAWRRRRRSNTMMSAS